MYFLFLFFSLSLSLCLLRNLTWYQKKDDANGPTITKNGSKTAMMIPMTMSDDSHEPSSNGNDVNEEGNKVTNGENQPKSGDGENGSSSSPMQVDKGSRSNDVDKKDREKDKDRSK